VTADTSAVNAALAAPDGMTTEAGKETALLVLARDTDTSLLAGALRKTVQLSVLPPVMLAVAQLKALRTGATGFDATGFNCNAKLVDALPAFAVSVAAWLDVTAATAAIKLAVVAPDRTVTLGGTETAGLLLAKLTAVSLVAAPLKDTAQASVVDPVAELLAHVNVARVGPAVTVPVPLNPTERGVDVEELVIISWPETVPVDAGLN